ncbi:hypothetical protein PCANC_04186 [Puccinia coronata f. sp. avenae]|uniref:Uncharacterized protein n=1 Tax=Puccinia coronata f. sp. avenae TaxID=200324 RepID=A0A2N5W7I4_9BASI|nr:hypothetical protein PCANC_20614 [Puccinia coronata f. sp. avenae]PLW58138.1 hypothetical protein PCANC_04186 [Puccinia coronata f. sp. avenae]
MICDSLDNKRHKVAAPTPTTTPGCYNPATAEHTKEECQMKRKPKPAAKMATNHHDGSDSEDPSSLQFVASGLLC